MTDTEILDWLQNRLAEVRFECRRLEGESGHEDVWIVDLGQFIKGGDLENPVDLIFEGPTLRSAAIAASRWGPPE